MSYQLLRSSLVIPVMVFVLPLNLRAAEGNPEQEYQQVRKIALRDPKVRAAYEEADRRLEEKIVRIDPALASYTQRRRSSGPVTAEAPRASSLKPARPHTAPSTAARRAHVVIQGDTLSSIARQYNVTVPALKAANGNPDEHKLIVGQVMAIPNPSR